jgi:hypothetical protein
MKHPSKVRLLTRSLTHLFVTKKGVNPTKLYPNEYYKCFWLPKRLCDGIDLIAKIEQISKKNAAELLMKAGLSSYMGKKLGEYIKNEQAARELNQKKKMTRFVQVLRRYARSKGMDISKII